MTDINKVLHILRNPHGFAPGELRVNSLKAADLIERNANPWISVDSRLPDDFDNVWVTYNFKGTSAETEVMYVFEGSWCSGVEETVVEDECIVTHWMPLPGPAR